jgi:hypothetical protein
MRTRASSLGDAPFSDPAFYSISHLRLRTTWRPPPVILCLDAHQWWIFPSANSAQGTSPEAPESA